MSTKSVAAAAMLAAFALSTPARALPITDVVDPADIYLEYGVTPSSCPAGFECGPGWLSFTHRITDDGFNVGDLITKASLVIHLAELWATGVNQEQYQYDFATQSFSCKSGNCVPNPGVSDTIVLDSGSLADLAADGVLQIRISALSGGFYFANSSLEAEFAPRTESLTQGSAPVPSTLLLLGAGLAAAGVGRFRGKRMA
jgi:hypothetical protein